MEAMVIQFIYVKAEAQLFSINELFFAHRLVTLKPNFL
jgi:hypothetical protein